MSDEEALVTADLRYERYCEIETADGRAPLGRAQWEIERTRVNPYLSTEYRDRLTAWIEFLAKKEIEEKNSPPLFGYPEKEAEAFYEKLDAWHEEQDRYFEEQKLAKHTKALEL